MSHCIYCGAELKPGAKYCPECGAEVTDNSSSTVSTSSVTLERLKSSTANHLKARISINGKRFGELGVGDSLRINLAAGINTIEIRVGGNKPLSMNINTIPGNQDIYFKVNSMGTPVICEDDGTKMNSSAYEENIKVKKNTGRVIGTILLIPVILISAFIILGVIFSDSDSENSASKSTQSEPVQESTEIADTPVQETPQTPTEPVFSPQTYTAGNWEITINDFQYKDSISSGLLTEYQAEENSKFCVVNLTVKNIGNEMDVFLPLVSFGDETSARINWNGYAYTPSVDVLNPNGSLFSETLNPLVSTSGDLIFEIPNEVIDSDTAPVLEINDAGSTMRCELTKR